MTTDTIQSPDILTEVPSDPIAFAVRTKPVTYGDNKTFHQFQIVMRINGRAVGSEEGPGREHPTRDEARKAGWARVAELRKCRLYAIDVTRECIADGVGRSCESCAIAQALCQSQDRIGLPTWEYCFNVAPYAGMFDTAYGIALRWGGKEFITGEELMPDVVWECDGEIHTDSMMEWAMLFDEWEDRQEAATLSDWRESMGYDDSYGEPSKPWPVSFVLNLSEMQPEEA